MSLQTEDRPNRIHRAARGRTKTGPAAQTPAPLRLGDICGHIPLAPEIAAKATRLARDHFAAEVENDFEGEDVESFVLPRWAPKRGTWWPTGRLAEIGFRLSTNDGVREDLVVTFGVDGHTDDYAGHQLCYVLHNDGLTFHTGRVRTAPKAGDWFIFDDRVNHGVKEATGNAVFVGWTIPLEGI